MRAMPTASKDTYPLTFNQMSFGRIRSLPCGTPLNGVLSSSFLQVLIDFSDCVLEEFL